MAKFLTKKFALIALVVIIATVGVIWAVVANIKPKFKSGITDVPAAYAISGNGTAAVMVDNYLYFVGGYTATNTIAYGENDYYAHGKMPETGIYRVKIEDSQPVVTYEYDNNIYDDEGNKTGESYTEEDEAYNSVVTAITDWEAIGNGGIEAVVPKIAGHDTTALWVFGNTLIYVTPNNLRNTVGGLRTGYLDFYRVDLNGKNHKLIYTTTVKSLTKNDFSIWADSTDNIYLLIDEDNTLRKINVNTQQITEIDSKVQKVVFPQVTQYRRNANNERLADVYGGVMGYLYYTKQRDSEEVAVGNLMYRYHIGSATAPEKIGDEGSYNAGTTFTPLLAANGQFIFSTAEVRDQLSAEHAITKYCVVVNGDLVCQTEAEYEALPRNIIGSDSDLTFLPGGFWLQGGKLRRYTVNNGVLDVGDSTVYDAAATGVLTIFDNKLYVQTEDAINIYDLTGGSQFSLLGTITLKNEDDNNEAQTAPFVASVLFPAYARSEGSLAGGAVLIHYAVDGIRLYYQNGTQFAYLKLFA